VDLPTAFLPRKETLMSVQQESIRICVWGFVETRGGVPEVVEATSDLIEEFAVLASTDRALQIGFSAADARRLGPVFEGSDDLGPFELRQFALADVELANSESLFVESNELADRVSDLLGDRGKHGFLPTLESLRTALADYDRRWSISRDEP
jgi:hypothetical protein